MKILKNDSSNNTTSNSNTKKCYKAISLAALSTLALTLALPVDIVKAVVGKPGATPPIRFYGSGGSRVVTAPHSRGNSTIGNNGKFNSTLHINVNSSGGKVTFTPGTKPGASITNPGIPSTKPTAPNKPITPGNTPKPSTSTGGNTTTKPTINTNNKPTTSTGTQTNLNNPNSPTASKKPTQFPINDDGFDSISLGSTNSSSSKGSIKTNVGSLEGNKNETGSKKGLSKKNKIALGALGTAAVLGTTIGLAAGLAPKGDSNSNSGGKDTTTPPPSVPTPSAPIYSVTGITTNPNGVLFIDEKA